MRRTPPFLLALAAAAALGCSDDDADADAIVGPEGAAVGFTFTPVTGTAAFGSAADSAGVAASGSAVTVTGRIVVPSICHDLAGRAGQRQDTIVVVVEGRPRAGSCPVGFVGARYQAEVRPARGTYLVAVSHVLRDAAGTVLETRRLPVARAEVR